MFTGHWRFQIHLGEAHHLHLEQRRNQVSQDLQG